MTDRFQQSFSERLRQSDAAKLANLEAFRAAQAPNSQDNADIGDQAPEMPPVMATTSEDSKVSSNPKSLLRWFPRRVRTPLLAATAGIAALGAAACTSGNSTEAPQAPTNQGEVLGAHATPVPTNAEQTKDNFITPGQKIGDFVLKGPDGNVFRSSDAIGKPMMIIFCCNQYDLEVHAINNLKSHYGNNIVILPIFVLSDPNSIPSVKQAYQEDPSDKNSLFARLMARGTPHFVPVSKDGIVGEGKDGDDNLNFLDSASQKLIDGVDVNEVFPTPAPGPTETSTPVITKEKPSSGEAVFDLGNFDLGVKEWEEWPNARPTQLEVGGKVVDVKNVVVKTIFRSKADRVSNLVDWAEQLLSNVSFVDSNGNDIEYYPGAGRVSVKIDEPLKYGGAINEPFVQTLNGDFIAIDEVCSSNKYNLDRFTDGFGIPVSIIATVPINVRDYGIAILEPGASKRKIVMKNEAATDFKTIAEDVPIHDPDYVFRLDATNGGYVDSSFRGLQRAQYSPGFPPDTLATFHFIDRFQGNPFYYFLLTENLFLKDGRVLQIGELAGGSLNFGQEGDLQGNVGGKNPENRCPLINPTTLRNANGFDLKDSIIVLSFGSQSVAWKVPD